MLADFFGRTGRPPDRPSARICSPGLMAVGLSGRRPASVTSGARIACLDSFYRFLIRMGLVTGNPFDAVERPEVVAGTPRGLDGDQIRRLLPVIPDDVAGRRDRAIVSTLVPTSCRQSEVLNLKGERSRCRKRYGVFRYRSGDKRVASRE
jgi:site-specific recombinase XerD